MTSKYKKHFLSNAFMALDPNESREVLGLSLVANDLMSNLEALKKIPAQENSYFFYNSIAIVREAAKLVEKIGKSTLSKKFSENTRSHFGGLFAVLAPFDDDSFTKSILKPIRDVVFHYDFGQSSSAGLNEAVEELRKQDQMEVEFISGNLTPGGQRYTFADTIRKKCVDQYLTTDIVSQLSTVAACICRFIDSLLNDLVS